ncbi:serine hydrolase [Deinococcus radiotolerans]|uniref:Serine hydrolase n=1 Tax=Deinococcus radiotolerans TaxID=1309407 RepID=A0ABQ2FJT0_9DEIO|nr:serine hydrolase [Deinococcus radiotolerans]GGK96487.1 serine hydrolase [Deinococcus radiotolerans]
MNLRPLIAALLVTTAHAAPTVQGAWHGAFYRLTLTGLSARDGTISWTPDGTGADVRFAATLPTLTRIVPAAQDQLQISVTGHTVQVRSTQGRPLRVNLMPVRAGVEGPARFTAIDVYPEEAWTDYEPVPVTPCRAPAPVPELPYQPPRFASGPLGFYLAQIDPRTGQPLRVITHDPDSLYPLASTFKQIVLWGTLRDVQAGRLTLNTRLTVTEANRSIEFYQPGTRTVQNLATQAIAASENTASDVLHLRYGPDRLQALVTAQGACNTRVNTTTKAWWAAQAGLLPGVYGPDLISGAAQAFALPSAQEAALRARAVTQAQTLNADRVLDNLDRYFFSPAYHPQTEVQIQNRSTPREWATLITRMYLDPSLSASNRAFLRDTLAKGCCRTKDPTVTYWGSKAGSGWRNVTISGLLSLNTGQTFVYAYFNNGSDTIESLLIEKQLPDIARYVLDNAKRLASSAP